MSNILLWAVALVKFTIVTNLLKPFDNQVVCLDRPPKWGTASVAVTKELVIKLQRNSVC